MRRQRHGGACGARAEGGPVGRALRRSRPAAPLRGAPQPHRGEGSSLLAGGRRGDRALCDALRRPDARAMAGKLAQLAGRAARGPFMIDLDHLRSWIGRSESREERLPPSPPTRSRPRSTGPIRPTARRCAPAALALLHFLPVSPLAEAGRTAIRRGAASCRQSPCPAACGREAASPSQTPPHRRDEPPRLDGDEGRAQGRQDRRPRLRHRAARTRGRAGPAIEEEHDIVYRGLPALRRPGASSGPLPPRPAGASPSGPIRSCFSAIRR